MNDRIKELADQASENISYRIDPHTLKHIDDPYGPRTRVEINKEKFAGLIVQECADISYKIAWDDLVRSEPESVIPLHIYNSIKEHFRVE